MRAGARARSVASRLLAYVSVALCAEGCSASAEVQSEEPFVSEHSGTRTRLSACLGPGRVACVAASKECSELLSCFGWQRDSCTGTGTCDGSLAAECFELANHVYVRSTADCANDAAGNHLCSSVDDGKSITTTCHAGACRGDRCEGGVRIVCLAGVEIRQDCAAKGQTCVTGTSGVFCAEPALCGSDACEDNEAVFCRDGHVEARQDCSELVAGGHCAIVSGAAECRRSPEHPVCRQSGPFSSFCDGSRAFACYLGALYEMDCAAFRGGECVTGDGGTGARCKLKDWP
jgi:hypothetical protein